MTVETCLCPAMEAVGVYRCAGLCQFAFLSTAEIEPGNRRLNELHLPQRVVWLMGKEQVFSLWLNAT